MAWSAESPLADAWVKDSGIAPGAVQSEPAALGSWGAESSAPGVALLEAPVDTPWEPPPTPLPSTTPAKQGSLTRTWAREPGFFFFTIWDNGATLWDVFNFEPTQWDIKDGVILPTIELPLPIAVQNWIPESAI